MTTSPEAHERSLGSIGMVSRLPSPAPEPEQKTTNRQDTKSSRTDSDSNDCTLRQTTTARPVRSTSSFRNGRTRRRRSRSRRRTLTGSRSHLSTEKDLRILLITAQLGHPQLIIRTRSLRARVDRTASHKGKWLRASAGEPIDVAVATETILCWDVVVLVDIEAHGREVFIFTGATG